MTNNNNVSFFDKNSFIFSDLENLSRQGINPLVDGISDVSSPQYNNNGGHNFIHPPNEPLPYFPIPVQKQ